MQTYTAPMHYAIIEGKVLESLAVFEDNSFDAILTDPPYGLGQRQPTPDEIAAYITGDELSTGGDFMGKAWNVPSVATWKALFRVLKPGGAVLCAGGPRVFDLVTIGMRMAGFEIRDSLCWMYGKGFPKSLNVSKAIDAAGGHVRPVIGTQTLTGNAAVSLKDKGGTYGVQVGTVPPKIVNLTGPGCQLSEQWDGYGTALKPGWEPIILARKPLAGTVVENVKAFGCGALNIDGCRLCEQGGTKKLNPGPGKPGNALQGSVGGELNGSFGVPIDGLGRWPANVALDEDAAQILDAEVGPRHSGKAVRHNGGGGQIFTGIGDNPYTPKPKLPDLGYLDGKTNVSRFFFSSKVSTKERERGCELLPPKSAGEMTEREEDTQGLESPRAGAGRTGGAHNHHPTLKPIALCQWEATMIKPPTKDACLLVPYSGAGSEVIGALLAGWPSVVGIEMDPDYVKIAMARIASWVPGAIKA